MKETLEHAKKHKLMTAYHHYTITLDPWATVISNFTTLNNQQPSQKPKALFSSELRSWCLGAISAAMEAYGGIIMM